MTLFVGLVVVLGLFRKTKVSCGQALYQGLFRAQCRLFVDNLCPVVQDHPMLGTRNQGHTTSPRPSAPYPVSAVCQALRAAVHQSPKTPAFPVSGAVFDKKLKAVTQGEGNLSGHSFRRGGACWALSQNIPGEVIKIMGDWKSTVYMSYLDQLPQPVLDYYRVVFSHALPRTCS